jgi:hypothetical protein
MGSKTHSIASAMPPARMRAQPQPNAGTSNGGARASVNRRGNAQTRPCAQVRSPRRRDGVRGAWSRRASPGMVESTDDVKEIVMEPDHGTVRAPTNGGGERDDSVPTLLLVSLAAVLAAVLGVAGISQVPTMSMLLVSLLVVLLGVVALTATIGRQLADDDGRTSPDDAPAPASVIDGPERSPGRRDDDQARLAA